MPHQSDPPPPSAGPRERLIDPWPLSVAVVWGVNTVINKWLLEYIGPAGILAFRCVSCTLVLCAAAWVLNRRGRVAERRPWGAIILVGLWVIVQQLIFIYSLDLTTASEAALIISIAPIWTAIIGAVIGAEAISGANWLGILAAAGGVALIVFGGDGIDASIPTRVRGDLWMLVSSILYGSFMVYSKPIMKRYGSLRVLSWVFGMGVIIVLPIGLPQLVRADMMSFSLTIWGLLLFSGLMSGGYGFVVWYRTIRRTTPARTAVYQYLVPVIALFAAAAFLGERMTALQITGAIVVLAGLVLARRSANHREEGPPDEDSRIV